MPYKLVGVIVMVLRSYAKTGALGNKLSDLLQTADAKDCTWNRVWRRKQ